MPINNEKIFLCPYCASENNLWLELSDAAQQEFVYDCETCCRPVLIKIKVRGYEIVFFSAEKENG